MINDRLERIGDYPFDRLRALLDVHSPRPNEAPISLAVGEPQHEPPPLLQRTVDANAHLWGRYPPVQGTPEFRKAVADWATRRYALPAGMIDPEANVIPVSGTREALFMIALPVVPESVRGRRPAVLMPTPFYQVYLGAAALAGAEPVFMPATRETGFLPQLDAVSEDILARTAYAYYCSPANPQGTVATLDELVAVVKLARAHGVVAGFDECYSEIWYAAPPPGGLEGRPAGRPDEPATAGQASAGQASAGQASAGQARQATAGQAGQARQAKADRQERAEAPR